MKLQQNLIYILAVVTFIVGCDSQPFDNKPFNQKLWLENPVSNSKSSNLRLYMSEDLMKNYLKTGMTRASTRKLLGQPHSTDSYCNSKNACDSYLLTEYVLVLRFDSANKLVKSEIVSV